MGYDLMPFFEDEKIDVIPVSVEETTGADGFPITTDIPGTPFRAVMWSRAIASRFFNNSWNEDVSIILATDNYGAATNKSKVIAAGNIYEVDSIDDVGTQGDIYLIGLVARR